MLKRDLTPRDGSQPGILRRRGRAGPSFLAAFAGLAVLGTGTATVALIGIHSTPALASSACQALPTAPSSPPPGPTPSVSPGGSVASKPESGPGSAAAEAPAATQLCVTVTAVTSTVQPGHPAQYTIDVQPTGGAATDVTVQISASPGSFPAPTFTVCGSGDGTQTCTLGSLGENKTSEVQAQDAVPSGASSGGSVTLTAKVTGVASGATTQGSVSGIASVGVVAPPPPTSPSTPKNTSSTDPSGHNHSHGGGGGGSGGHSGGSGSGGQGSSQNSGLGNGLGNGLGSNLGTGLGTKLGFTPSSISPTSNFNPLTGLAGTGSGADPSSLFPTINPSPGASGTGGSTPAASDGRTPYHPTSVADVLPLNNGQVGAQVAGMIALALGIIVAVVRVSVRKPRTQDKQ
jgi:hypothetical protein